VPCTKHNSYCCCATVVDVSTSLEARRLFSFVLQSVVCTHTYKYTPVATSIGELSVVRENVTVIVTTLSGHGIITFGVVHTVIDVAWLVVALLDQAF
jgi:hypothetical protein